MAVRKDNIQLDIEINGKSAGKTLRDLQNESRGLNAQIRNLEPGTDDFVKKAGELKTVNTQITAIRQTTRGGVREIREAANAIAQFGEEGGRRLIKLRDQSRQLEQQMATLPVTSREFADTARRYDSVNKEINKIEQSAQRTGGVLQRFGTLLQAAVGGIVALRADRILQSGINFIRSSFTVIGDFNRQLGTLAAISGANAEELARLEASAKDLGASTERSASEVLGLQIELSKLGFTADEVLNTVEAALDGATLAGTDLSQTAILIGSTLRAFGEDTDQSGRLVDILGSAFSKTALDADKFGVAISAIAPVARNAGISMEETTALLGVLADNGIDASTSGTALRGIFLDLAKEGRTLSDALEEINSAQDANAAAVDLFGKRGATVAAVLSKNTDRVKELTGAFEESEGFAKKAADAIRDDLTGDLDILRSTVESVQIAIGEKLDPVFRSFVQLGTRAVSMLGDLIAVFASGLNFIYENRAAIIGVTAALVALNVQMAIAEARTISFAAGISRLVLVKKAVAIATGIWTAAQRILNFVLVANPIGLVVTLIAGLIAWIVSVASQSDTFRERVGQLWESFRPLIKAVKDLVMNFTPLGQVLQLLGRLFGKSEGDVSSWGSVFSNTFNGILSLFTEVLGIMVEGLTSFIGGVTKVLRGDFREGLKEIGQGIIKTNPIGIAFTEGERLGKSFSDGYSKAERDARQKRLDDWNARIKEEVAAERERQAALEEERKKEEQKRIEEEAQRKREEKEAAEARIKAREEEFKRRGEVIKEAFEKERAIIERENIELARTEEDGKNLILDAKRREIEERLLLLQDFGQGETAEAENLRTELVKIEQQITDNSVSAIRARFKARESEIKEASGRELLELELLAAQGLVSERDFQSQRTAIKREELQKQLDLLREFGDGETAQALKLQTELAELDAADSKRKEEKKKTDFDREQEEQKRKLEEEKARQLIENATSDQSLRERLARQMEIEAEFAQRKKELDLIQVQERLDFLKEIGLGETAAFRDLELEKLRIQQEIGAERMAQAKRESESKINLEKEFLKASEDFLGATIDLLKAEEGERKKKFGVIKAFEVAKVKINMFTEISEIFKSFASLGPIGQVLAVIKAAEAKIRGISAIRSISAEKYAGGGRAKGVSVSIPGEAISGRMVTESPNAPRQPGGDNVLAFLKRGEVVLNDLQQKKLGGPATFRKIGVPGFAAGGLSTQSTTPTGVSNIALDDNNQQANEANERLINEVRGLRQDLSEFPRSLRANVVINEFEAKQKEVHDIQRQADL